MSEPNLLYHQFFKHLEDIREKLYEIGERMGRIEEKISYLEERAQRSEREGDVLRTKQIENDSRISNLIRDISDMKEAINKQGQDIAKLKEEVQEIKRMMGLANILGGVFGNSRVLLLIILMLLFALISVISSDQALSSFLGTLSKALFGK